MVFEVEYTNGNVETIREQDIFQYDFSQGSFPQISERGVGCQFNYLIGLFIQRKPLIILGDSLGYAMKGRVETKGRRLINLDTIKTILEIKQNGKL